MMLRQFSLQRIFGFFFIDWICTMGALFMASYLRAEMGRLPEPLVSLMNALNIQTYGFWRDAVPGEILPLQVFLLVAVLWPFYLIVFSVYDGRRNPTPTSEILNVFLAIGVATLSLAGLLYFTYRETPRVLVLIFFFLDVILLVGGRMVWNLTRRVRNPPLRAQRRSVMIIGAGPVGQNVVQQLRKYALADIELVGFLDDDPAKQGISIEGMTVLGPLEFAADLPDKISIHDAIVALPLDAHDRMVEICKVLQRFNIHVHVIPDLFALSFPGATLDGFGGIPVIDLGKPGLQVWQRTLKRAFDTVAVTIGLLLLSPILLLIAILIKLDSKGPVFYRQIRIGELGRQFSMFKFRSMRVDADPAQHKAYVTRLIEENLTPEQVSGEKNGSLKMEDDPRITRVGKFIRKASLDELPQLINVLRGEMSLVGPRPPLLYEVALYQDWHKRRFEVPPGITGLWQVKGRNRVSFDEMVRMDLEYIEHQSLWLDIKLLMQTPAAVLSARGAG